MRRDPENIGFVGRSVGLSRYIKLCRVGSVTESHESVTKSRQPGHRISLN